MRVKIWEKDDHFEVGTGAPYKKYTMDPEVVDLSLKAALPVTVNFDRGHMPRGTIVNLVCEDGEITGELVEFKQSTEIADLLSNDETKELYRLGGYYGFVEFNEEKDQVISARLLEVSLIARDPATGRPGDIQNFRNPLSS